MTEPRKDSRGWIISDDGRHAWDGTAWQPRTISEDGNYVWDGTDWQLRSAEERGHENRLTEQPAKVQRSTKQVESSATAPGVAQKKDSRGWIVSDDGRYVWDGTAWQPRRISEDGNYVWDGSAWQLRSAEERGHENRVTEQPAKVQNPAKQAESSAAAASGEQQRRASAAEPQRKSPPSIDVRPQPRPPKSGQGRDLLGGRAEAGATSVETRTNELVNAYRTVRREHDRDFFFDRAAAVVYLVDSSGAAYGALVQRHDVPDAAASLKAVHDAFVADDLLRKANAWRKTVFAIFGISGTTVLIFGVNIIGKAISEGQTIAAYGGSGLLLIAAATTIKAGYDAFSSRKPSPTEDQLRPVEKQFYEAVGGSPPVVHRAQLLRLAGALVGVCIGFAINLLILGLLAGWLQSLPPPYTVPSPAPLPL